MKKSSGVANIYVEKLLLLHLIKGVIVIKMCVSFFGVTALVK